MSWKLGKNFIEEGTPKMHPTEFKGFVEHLYEVYSSLHDEVARLRRENKNLHEELGRWRAGVSISRPMRPRPLKMGADWCIDGDFVASLSLISQLRFPSPICNVRISPKGQIAFTANKRIILLKDEVFYAVDETIHPFDPASMKTDLSENYRCIFEFADEDFLAFCQNGVRKFSGMECKWVFTVSGVYHLAVSGDLVYVGTVDGKLLIVREGVCLRQINCKVPIKFFTSVGPEIVGFSDTQVEVIRALLDNAESPKRTQLPPMGVAEQSRILALCAIGPDVYYGGELPGVRVCRLSNGISVQETLPQKKPVIALGAWGQRLVVSSQDKIVSIWDPSRRKCMRIVTHDDVVDIATNETTLCFVDNNGSLRIWQISGRA